MGWLGETAGRFALSRALARRSCAALLLGALAIAATPPLASAAASPQETLTYIPFGFVHNEQSSEAVDEYLSQLSSYGIGQVLLPMPRFKKTGLLKLSRHESRMIPLWSQRAAAANAATGSDLTVTAVFAGRVKPHSLNLELPATRAAMIAGIESVLALGVGGVQLDLEPYPYSAGFLALLEELDAAFARRGFAGRLSVTAPAHLASWPPAYLHQVSALVGQLDPLFYDGEFTTQTAYERWVAEGLAYYSANSAPGARIVPVIPSYGPNRWHRPEIEDVASATVALGEGLQQGSRVNGVGLFWWWGFFYDEEGAFAGAADRGAWQSSTLGLPYTP
jgi:hypothetical protein